MGALGVLALAVALVTLSGVPAVAQNPFEGGARPAPGLGLGPRPAEPAPGLTAPAAAPGLGARVMAWVNTQQRALNQTLSREMRAIRQTGSPAAMLTVGLVAFLYGVLHAAGPGHGKLVVSAFFLGREARIVRGLVVGAMVSLLQTLSAIALVGVVALIVGRTGFAVMQHSAWMEVVSYGLIVLIGLAMTAAALMGRHLGHRHHEGTEHAPAETGLGRSLVVAAGLTPCASAVIIMLFALANGVVAVGILATLVMAVGMSLTVALVGIATIAARRSVLGLMGFHPRATLWLRRGLTLAGAVLITVVGGVFFASAWTRLY